MIVLMQGGGPANGLYKNFPNGKRELRIGTAESLADGMAAVYVVSNPEAIPGLRAIGAVATFIGMRKTATALLDMMVE